VEGKREIVIGLEGGLARERLLTKGRERESGTDEGYACERCR